MVETMTPRRVSLYRVRKRDRETGRVLDSRLYSREPAAMHRAQVWAELDAYTVTLEASPVYIPMTEPVEVEMRDGELVALPRFPLAPLYSGGAP